MELIINNEVLEKQKDSIYQFFYHFYEKLYGKEVLHRFRIKNMIKAETAINMLKNLENMKLLKVVEKDEILAISRYRINGNYDELIVSEIIVDEKLDKAKRDQIYKKVLMFYEEYAKYTNLPKIFLEMPWFDINYQYWASEFDYEFPSDAELFNVGKNTTYLVQRNTQRFAKYDEGLKNEWPRSRKQTKE